MNAKSKALLTTASGLLVQYMEILNKIDEKDFLEIVNKARMKKRHLKNILDNAGRGNPFMIAFFLRELIDSLIE